MSETNEPPTQSDTNVAPTAIRAPLKKESPPIVELKPGKVLFRQKPFDWSNGLTYMKALVGFREYIESQDTSISSIPDEYLHLIAKLIHENDKTLNILCKNIKKILAPPAAENESLEDRLGADKVPQDAIEKAVMRVAERRNYGIDNAPAAYCIWRWEVKDLSMIQDAVASKDTAAKRLAQRLQAKVDLVALFGAMSLEEQESIMKGNKRSKSDSRTEGGEDTKRPRENSTDAAPEDDKPSKDPENKPSKKPSNKEKEKVENMKSAAVMASFFSKASTSRKTQPQAESASSSKTDFERHFRPFALRKHTKLAPTNKFQHEQAIAKEREQCASEIIALDGDGDIEMISPQPVPIPKASLSDNLSILAQFLATVPSSRKVRPTQYYTRDYQTKSTPGTPHQHHALANPPRAPLKSDSTISVRKIMAKLVEAEVNGDEKTTRRLLGILRDRRKIPAKLLQFSENARPAYYGTWTKTSSFIGPRTPLAKDIVVFDYSYDSGDDWAEEEVEDPEDILSEAGSNAGPDEFEEDDWMVADDVIEMADDAEELKRSTSPQFLSPADGAKKRKADSATAAAANKRRHITGPLIPFSKGPFFEYAIGRCDYDPFDDFRIMLLNDSYIGMNPFTFVSTCVEDVLATKSSSTTTTNPHLSDFVVPLLPPHILSTRPTNETSYTSTANTTKKTGPSFTLPEAHFPSFLLEINGSEVSKPILVENLFQKFRSLDDVVGLRKGAIEIKLAEIAYKEKKVWRVKTDVWANAGLAPP